MPIPEELHILRQTKFQRYHFHRYDPFTADERGGESEKDQRTGKRDKRNY